MKKFCPKQTVYFVSYHTTYCWRDQVLQAWRPGLLKWERVDGEALTTEHMELYLGKNWKRFLPSDPPEGVIMPCPW